MTTHGEMTVGVSLLSDLASYASAFAILTAWVCHRANPRRPANRAVVRFLVAISAWQLFAAVSHVSIDERFWALWCTAAAVLAVVQLYLLHDTCVAPQHSLWNRLRRSRLAWLIAAAVLLASLTKIILPDLQSTYPVLLKLPAFVAILFGLLELRTRSRAAEAIIVEELQFFYAASIFFALNFVIVLLFPGHISSRVNSGITIVWLALLLARLMRDRIFEVGRTTEVTLGYVLRSAILFTILVPLLYVAKRILSDLFSMDVPLSIVFVLLVYPAAVVSDRSTRLLMKSFPILSESAIRRRALAILETATSPALAILHIEALARNYLRGLEVTVYIAEGALPRRGSTDRGATLREKIRTRWLTPQNAREHFLGPELTTTLFEFSRTGLGAIIKFTSRHADVFLSIQQRQGGLKPIRPRELELLYELATVIGASLDRLRSAEESLRARQMAAAGRLAADFSHSARNQIAAILALVETVKNGDTALLTPEYREAVYQETLALAANHNLANEIARLDGDKLDHHTINLGSILASVCESYRHLVRKLGGEIHVSLAEATLQVRVDERLFRQVLLNLLRNSLQACAGIDRVPEVRLHARSDDDRIYIDVTDNGPGVTAPVFDRLFTPWATTKADGTGLGLVFCLQAMRTLGGTVKYLTPRGHEHAWFRLELPACRPALAA